VKVGAHAGRRREAEIAARDHRLAAAVARELLGLTLLRSRIDPLGREQGTQPGFASST
jgi:hypothetical protein